MDALSESLINGVPLPAVIIAEDEKVSAMNQAATDLFGNASLNRHHATLMRQPELQAALNGALRQREPATVRLVIAGASRDAIYRVTVTPLPGINGALCVLEDQTEAEQVTTMRREFVANVSHELRSPLTALLGFIETLRGSAKNDPAARDRFLSIMEREAGRMNRLIHDLLHLSKVEAEERVRPRDNVDLLDILKSTISTLRPAIDGAGVEVAILGEASRHVLPGDADQLVQVFQNLLENAVKYGATGGRIEIRLSEDMILSQPALRVDVVDFGEGIDSIHIPRLTERFYRIDGHRSREKGGTGLGLAIVKHIVQRHRGRFRIESEPGKGSIFSVILPLN